MTRDRYSTLKKIIIISAFQISAAFVHAQKVYFIDGYHGGVYGHYPKQYTRFITDALDQNPGWKINLELEPETWDSVQMNEPANYDAFKKHFADQSSDGRVEYVNPSYGQGYLYNINGESIIRQFHYGILKLKKHFPAAVFTTYSSEEPCFTSALPQILSSFGFKYASLKNPNTCWGGYTRAFGGELVNWVGPDGTKLIAVPRYAMEALQPNSTWQTISFNNSTAYLDAAFKAGIAKHVGICLQDAGWKNGPWLGKKPPAYETSYKTWRDYIKNTAVKQPGTDWHFSQEDVQVSLVWGAQVLQKIARQVRVSENKIVTAEKLAAMAKAYKGTAWPAPAFDEAWRGLLLAQHHDCWIVPYNGQKGNTWIDKVQTWTSTADRIADSAIQQAMLALSGTEPSGDKYFIRVFNTLGLDRNEYAKASLPAGFDESNTIIADHTGKQVPSQIIVNGNIKEIIFKARVPATGYSTYQLTQAQKTIKHGNSIRLQQDGNYKIETNLYSMIIDANKGGTIKSLIAKTLDNKEFVDKLNERSFNELRGYFYKDSSYFSSTQHPATVTIIEDGVARSRLQIEGFINNQPFTQTITLLQDEPVIDLKVKIDWKGNPGIGNSYKQTGGYKSEDTRKAFYDDSDKLLTLFPLNLAGQKVYKNAPFDVTESKLANTFFQGWDSIKNNVMLNWVDVTDEAARYGLALFTGFTTSYAHGQNFPLGLTTQYSGVGLWGRNYSITGPTEIDYAILPHEGRWDKNNIWTSNTGWNNPMKTNVFRSATAMKNNERSLIRFSGKGLETTAILMDRNDLLVRIFNAQNTPASQQVHFDGTAKSIDLVELNGMQRQHLQTVKNSSNGLMVNLTIPRFGIRTLRLTNFKTAIPERKDQQ